MEYYHFNLLLIILLGVGAQWASWRLNLPGFVVLLSTGFLVGPVLGIVHPDRLLGDLLFPVISLSVALILFEMGLSLRLEELRTRKHSLWCLSSVGFLIAWALTSFFLFSVLSFPPPVSILTGAILVITGPAVIVPLLRRLPPVGRAGWTLKWEGIVNDFLGLTAVVIVFQILQFESPHRALLGTVLGVLQILGVALFLGLTGLILTILLFKSQWLPHHLQNAVTLTLVLTIFSLSELFLQNSGYLSVALLGFFLANQTILPVFHILKYKENFRILLIAIFFIILSARVDLSLIVETMGRSFLFLGLLIFIVRPASVFLSTWASHLTLREKTFLAFTAPRGIVAAALASSCALWLDSLGYSGGSRLLSEVFFIIFFSAVLYSLSTPMLARLLNLKESPPRGLLLVGAHAWVIRLARILKRMDVPVLLLDSNRSNLSRARMEDLPTYFGNILSPNMAEEIEDQPCGMLLALTNNDMVDALTTKRYAEIFGSESVFRLPPEKEASASELDLLAQESHGKLLFAPWATGSFLSEQFREGAYIKAMPLSEQNNIDRVLRRYGDRILPMFILEEGRALPFTIHEEPEHAHTGQVLISMILRGGEEEQEEPLPNGGGIGSPPVN